MTWTDTLIPVVVTMAVAGPVCFFLGQLAAPDPPPLSIDLAAPSPEQRECIYLPTECPVAECPPRHDRAQAARIEAEKLDAYLAGAESIWWATPACDAVAEHGPGSCCSQVVDQVWDVEYDLSMLSLRVNMESVETNNWWKACRELLRVWPTESKVEGNYPEDFPKYCW